jgi:hypothetical protein
MFGGCSQIKYPLGRDNNNRHLCRLGLLSCNNNRLHRLSDRWRLRRHSLPLTLLGRQLFRLH